MLEPSETLEQPTTTEVVITAAAAQLCQLVKLLPPPSPLKSPRRISS
jgi:hypothetical protein